MEKYSIHSSQIFHCKSDCQPLVLHACIHSLPHVDLLIDECKHPSMCMVLHVYNPVCEDWIFSVIGWNSVAFFGGSFVKLHRFPVLESGLI